MYNNGKLNKFWYINIMVYYTAFTCGRIFQFSSVTQSCPTLCDPMNQYLLTCKTDQYSYIIKTNRIIHVDCLFLNFEYSVLRYCQMKEKHIELWAKFYLGYYWVLQPRRQPLHVSERNARKRKGEKPVYMWLLAREYVEEVEHISQQKITASHEE